MKDNTHKAENEIGQLGNVDQIREILFGSQTRELNKRFEKLENDIKRSQDEIKAKIEQNQKDFNLRLDNEVELISKKIKNITIQQQEEIADIRDNELKQEKRVQNSIDILNDELSAKHEQLYKEQLENRNNLQEAITNLKNELFDVMEEKLLELSDLKLSRDDAAEIMMETAMRLKGNQLEKQIVSVQNN
jgi:outer membrane murein-binding lipoprotein Lpp